MINERGFTVVEFAVIAIVVATVAVVGWTILGQNDQTRDIDTTISQEQVEVDQKVAVFTSQSFQTDDGQAKITFTIPEEWTQAENTSTQGEYIVFTNQEGEELKWWHPVDGLGGGCNPETPRNYIHSVEEVPGISNGYLVQAGSVENIDTLGLVDSIDGKEPKVGPTESCLTYLVYQSGETPIALTTSIQVLGGDTPAMESERIAELREVILSAEIVD